MARLLGRLKVEMNGVVSDSMKEKGISYPLNYGVSLPTIRSIAEQFKPDHSLAGLLYRQQVRELKLSALVVAEPSLITVADMDFWVAGIENTEVAENIAMLMGDANIGDDVVVFIAQQWLASPNDFVKYAGALALARQIANRKDMPLWRSHDKLQQVLVTALQSPNRYVWQGVAMFLGRLALAVPETSAWIKQFVRQIGTDNPTAAQYLDEELSWQLE